MSESLLRVLVCDDNVSFARSLAADLSRKLAEEAELNQTVCCVESISRLATLRRLSQRPNEADKWDIVFCDLGWGDLTLEGIQVLHDFQISHPNIFTVLYTAQDENESVEQALEWKLHFIDKVLRIGETYFLKKMVAVITEQWTKKGSVAEAQATGQKQQRFMELIQNAQRFPRIETHDLIALSKSAYIRFIQEKFGGFPQMAKTTGLDLNNIYRVNRRFKNAPFVVFKYDTIQIIFSVFGMEQRNAEIQKLLCPVEILRKALTSQGR